MRNIELRKIENNNGFRLVIITLRLVLLQSDTAGHHRALGDQVNMAFKLEDTDTFCRKLQGAHQDSSIKNYVKYKVSASIVISWGLSS